MVFNTGLYTDLPDNSILITANMQSETGFPSNHQLKSYVAFKSRLKLAARAVLSADAGLLVLHASTVELWPVQCCCMVSDCLSHAHASIVKMTNGNNTTDTQYAAITFNSSIVTY